MPVMDFQSALVSTLIYIPNEANELCIWWSFDMHSLCTEGCQTNITKLIVSYRLSTVHHTY